MSLNLFLMGRRDEGRTVPKCCTIQRVFKSVWTLLYQFWAITISQFLKKFIFLWISVNDKEEDKLYISALC